MDSQHPTGIFPDISNDAYHAGPGISKSGLWTIYSQTPAHFRFPPEKEETTQSKAIKDMGTATHTAILEPEHFEARVMKGPPDRRGNNWKELAAEATNTRRVLLTADQFDQCRAIRDVIHADPWLRGIIQNKAAQVEHSAYWIDDETGELVRSRPDLYRPDLGVMLDLKTCASARSDDFERAAINHGYHVQEAIYSEGHAENGAPVAGFVFLAVEKESPYAFSMYEFRPSIVAEGQAIYRKSLATYAECKRNDTWPGYAAGVQQLAFKRWHYAETEAPDGTDD